MNCLLCLKWFSEQMKHDEQVSVEEQLRKEAKRGEGFPPFLHRRIMAAVREEAQLKAQPKWVVFKWTRFALAGGVAVLTLFLALKSSAPSPERAGLPIGKWIATAAHSDHQVASLISDKVLNEWMTQPYQQQLDSISGELENALDFTLRMVPIKIAQR